MLNKPVEEFGKSLIKARKKAGLTQLVLGIRCGLSSSYISYYENSEHFPSLESAIKVAEFLEMTVGEMLGEATVKSKIEIKYNCLSHDNRELVMLFIEMLSHRLKQKIPIKRTRKTRRTKNDRTT